MVRELVGTGSRLICLTGLLVLAGCAAAPEPVTQDMTGSPPPAWLDHPPVSKDELCAIGVSGPSYYPEDAVSNSKAMALVELARGLEVKIKSKLRVRQEGDSMGRSAISVSEVSDFTTEKVVRLAQVRAQWVNAGGYQARGKKGAVYTLACMPLAL